MQEAICSGNGQTASDDNTPTNLLDALNLPVETRCAVMEMFSENRPRNISEHNIPLLPLLMMAGVNRAMQLSQGLSSGLLLKLNAVDSVGALDGIHLNLFGLLHLL